MFSDSLPSENQPLVGYIISAQGGYSILIPVTALLALMLTMLLAKRGRDPFAGFALLLIAPLPLIVSLIGALHGAMHTSFLLSVSENPSPNGVWRVFGIAALFAMVGFLHAVPSYAVAVAGLLIPGRASETPRRKPCAREVSR